MIQVEIDTKTIDDVRFWLLARPEQMVKQLNRAVEASIFAVERQTKINSPKKTGTMRASVNAFHYPNELSGEVFAGVRYAIYVHDGTKYMRGRPFMLNAVKALTSKINDYFRKALERVANK